MVAELLRRSAAGLATRLCYHALFLTIVFYIVSMGLALVLRQSGTMVLLPPVVAELLCRSATGLATRLRYYARFLTV